MSTPPALLERRRVRPAWLRNLVAVPLVLLTVALAFVVWRGRQGLDPEAFRRRMPLRNPVAVAWDGGQRLYVLDDRYYRILQMDLGGRVERQIGVRAVDQAHYEYWSELAVDGDGVLYASRVVYFVDTELVDREEICRIPPDGTEEIIYVVEHHGDETAFDTRLLTFQVDGGHLYFDVRSKDSVTLWRIPLAGGAAERVLDIASPKSDVYNMAGIAAGRLWITSYSGDRVLRLDASGKLEDAAFTPSAPAVPGIVLADKIVRVGAGLYLTDMFNQCVYRVRDGGSLEVWLAKADLPDRPERALYKDIWARPDGGLAVVESIWRRTDGTVARGEGGRVLVFGPDRSVVAEVTHGTPSPGLWLTLLLPWLGLLGLVLSFVATVLYVYLAVLSRRVALVLKLILAFVPLVIASIAFVATSIFARSSTKVEEEIKYRLAVMAQAGARSLDGDAVDRIRRPTDYQGEDYTAVAGQLDALVNGAKDPWNQRVFANVAKIYNGMAYIMDDNAQSYGVLYPMPAAPVAEYQAVLATGELRTYEYTDADGTFIEASAPIRTKAGQTVAVLYVGSSKDDLVLLQEQFRNDVIRNTAIATAVLLAAVIGVSVFLLLSVNRLRGAVGRMARGEWDAEVRIRSRDEIGELGQGFNTMSRHIRGYISEITEMSDAYARFVPREFLRYLGKDRIAQIQLGNQVELDMAILFADIRSFTTISEAMKPQENFNFLNSYLNRMGPVIRKHNGFIDKYLGDGIMALFPGGAADALAAGVDMQRELVTYNMHRARSGYAPIAVGVGVHAGKVMLGILGEQERMDGTVIADAVNLASRLEGLTKTYGVWILSTEETLAGLGARAPEHRFLGRAEVKGKSEPVSICEIFAADPPEEIKRKLFTRKVFERGVKLIFEGNTAEALRHFRAVLDADPADPVARYYVRVCEDTAEPKPA